MAVLFCTPMFAAEYVVKKNDNLTTIAKNTNHKVRDLANLNEVGNPNLIFPGQKIFYISKKDLENAKAWAKKRRSELSLFDPNYDYFGWVIEDIKTGNLRYLINQPNGTHASSILVFSGAWEKQKKD